MTDQESFLHIKWDIPSNAYINTNGQAFDQAVLDTASGLVKILSRYCFVNSEIITGGRETVPRKHSNLEGVFVAHVIFLYLMQYRFPYLLKEAVAHLLGVTLDTVKLYAKKHKEVASVNTLQATSYRGLLGRIERDFDHDYPVVASPVFKEKQLPSQPVIARKDFEVKSMRAVTSSLSFNQAIPYIFEYVCKEMAVTELQLESSSRLRHIVDARIAFFALVRHFFRLTTKKAGSILNKDHATVIHSGRNHASLLETSDSYRQHYNALFDKVRYLVSEGLSDEQMNLRPMAIAEMKAYLESKNLPSKKIEEISDYFTKQVLARAKFPPNEIKRICKEFGVDF